MEEEIELLIKSLNEKANGCSLMRVIIQHQSFKKLVSMGDIVVAPIMQKILNKEGQHWMYWLLEEVAKYKPLIPRQSFSDIDKLRNIWKYWFLESDYNKNKQNDE
jgi:predicted hydrocarbon binding protein